MEQHTKAQYMEFSSYPYGSFESELRDHSNTWLQSDSPAGYAGFSVSVIYQPSDFPFPSIQYPSQSEDLLDSQFSIGCVHGGGSMLSSLDVSLESCLDEAKASTRLEIQGLVSPKDGNMIVTPVRSLSDCQVGSNDNSCNLFVRGSHNHLVHHYQSQNRDETVNASLAVPGKEPNPVEFRSGYRGVSWNRRMKAWLAFWSEGKNRRSKTFNAKVMGFDKARAAAIDFLKKKKQLLQQLDPSYNDGNDGADEDYGEGSMADSATTTSDTPTSSEYCAICGNMDRDSATTPDHLLNGECYCGQSYCN